MKTHSGMTDALVAHPPEKPLLLFDGECGFCRRWIARWREESEEGVDYEPFQKAAVRFPELKREQFDTAVQLIETDGNVFSGAEAVFRALAHAPSRGSWIWLYRNAPGFAPVSEWFYGVVARHRRGFSTVTRLFWGSHVDTPRFSLSRCLFLRLLGIVYLIAFVSLWVQIDGLIGQQGILPVSPFLDAVSRQTGASRYWLVPTLCWIDPADAFLHLLCGGGALLSLLLILGLLPAPICFLLWLFYLSLTTVCRTFLGFQWDNLLLEAGFLAVFVSPLRLRCRLGCGGRAERTALLLVRWLLFRLIFLSGIVKLTSGDPTWRSLTALRYHYETQPLPTVIGWYAHQLPGWFQKGSVALMFFIELIVPFLIFGPRRLKLFAFFAIVGLQIGFGTTGNFAFFNLLTIALCLVLVDDAAWPARLKSRLPSAKRPVGEGTSVRWPSWIVFPVAAVVLIVSSYEILGRLDSVPGVLRPAESLARAVAPFRTINSYGLFAVMTTRRPEIIVEASNDGTTWLPYEFRWKPGEVKRRPGWVAPHQPRLDWQMWFAALEDYRSDPWFVQFLVQLLKGSPDVLALLERNPFPQAPPRFVRAVLYDYHFTDFAQRRAEGTWWKRNELGLYCPVLTKTPDGRVVIAGGGMDSSRD